MRLPAVLGCRRTEKIFLFAVLKRHPGTTMFPLRRDPLTRVDSILRARLTAWKVLRIRQASIQATVVVRVSGL